ncbi:MAG: hypothetical protein JSW49_00545 [candidate division WOR-3 bacterium]|nr:MAG: hypothetical protein JSW49_00545 [candidate division WOR-3 bacterium]
MNGFNRHRKIIDIISGVSILAFPAMLLIGFLLHPDILSFEIVSTPEQLANNFRGSAIWHIGHLIVAFAIPFIIFAVIHFMNVLKEKGLWYGIVGGVAGIFGSVALGLDKGSLCLILSGFDTLPDEQFVGLIPYLQVIIDKAGLLVVNWLFLLIPIGVIIQTIGLVKEKYVARWQGTLIIIGLLLLINPDIEIISTVGAFFMIAGFYPLGVQTIRNAGGR